MQKQPFWQNLSSNQRLLILGGGVMLIIIIIVVIIAIVAGQSASNSKRVLLDNQSQYESQLESKYFSLITGKLYSVASINVSDNSLKYDGTIRSGSFKKDGDTVTFIADIPSIKLSFNVVIHVDSNGDVVSDIGVQCVSKDQAIYPYKECKTVEENASDQLSDTDKYIISFANNLPITTTDYKITYGIDKNSSTAVTVILYTTNSKNEAVSKIESLGFDPAKLNIQYIIAYGD